MEKKGRQDVAVVDDDEESALILQEFLESEGLAAERFPDAEALLGATPLRFDAILLDIHLPGMWGSECGYQLRRLGYKGLVIAITGNLESWNLEDLQDIGFSCAMGKPLNPSRLIDLLRQGVPPKGTSIG